MRPRLDFVRCFDEHGSGFRPFNHHMKLSVDFATFHMALYPNPTLGTTVPDILHFMQTAVLKQKHISVWRIKNNFLLMSQRFMLLQTKLAPLFHCLPSMTHRGYIK